MSRFISSSLQGGSPGTLSASARTLVGLSARTGGDLLTTAEIEGITFGCNATPADNVITYDVVRHTTAIDTGGNATVPTPVGLTARPSGTVATLNPTAQVATVTASLYSTVLNARATFRWVAIPGGAFIIPATNLAGILTRALCAAGGTAVAAVEFNE